MRISKKSQLLVVLLVASCLALGAVEQTKSEKSKLQFTISNEPGEWDASWEQPMQIAKPTHVAVFQLENLRIWKSPWISVIAKVKGESKRSLQRVAFTGEGSLTQPYEFLLSMDGAGMNRMEFWLYAASEQEAHKMAEVLFDGAKSLAYAYVQRAEARLEDYRKRVIDIENEIPKMEIEKKTADAKFAECKKTTYYRNRDEAQKSILEWNNLLNVVEVDIIGVQAKLRMINQLEKREDQSNDALRSLVRLRLATDVELAGALARKNAARLFGDKALKFLDLAEKLDSLQEALGFKLKQLSSSQNKVASIERRLPQERADVRPVKVVGNEVKIHPIK